MAQQFVSLFVRYRIVVPAHATLMVSQIAKFGGQLICHLYK